MTDSTQAIQSALDTIGFYQLTSDVEISQVIVRSGCSILGNGFRIYSTSTECAIRCESNGNIAPILLRDFQLIGNSYGKGAGISIEHNWFTIDNVAVGQPDLAFKGSGSDPANYDFDTCFEVNYPNSVYPTRLINSAGFNFKTQGLVNEQGNDIVIQDCLFASNSRQMFGLTSVPFAGMNLKEGSGKIHQVHCFGGTGYGAIIGGGDYQLRGSHFEGSQIAMIYVTGAGAIIDGCRTFFNEPDADIPKWKSWGYAPVGIEIAGENCRVTNHIFGHLTNENDGWLPLAALVVSSRSDYVVTGERGRATPNTLAATKLVGNAVINCRVPDAPVQVSS